MKIQSVYSKYYYNSKNINFGELFDDDKLKSNHYSDFIHSSRAQISRLVLGEDLSKPMKFDGVGKDFDIHFDMYGVGKLHLLLMPNVDGINNFAKYYRQEKDATLKSIARVTEIVEKTHPGEDLYLFESGASDRLKEINKNGVVPAHLHYVTNKKDSSADIDKIHSYLCEIVGNKSVRKFKSVSMDYLFNVVSDLSKNGELEYKFIAKKMGSDKFDVSLYYCEEGDKLFVPKSQVPSKVLSRIFYGEDNPSYYNWKNIDADPKNWSSAIREKITKDRAENGKFVRQIKSLGWLVQQKTENKINAMHFYKTHNTFAEVGKQIPLLILFLYIIKLNLSKEFKEKDERT